MIVRGCLSLVLLLVITTTAGDVERAYQTVQDYVDGLANSDNFGHSCSE